MTQPSKHKWPPPSWLRNPIPAVARFHDTDLEVYQGQCDVSDIRLWRKNFRTLLDLEHLHELKKGRSVASLKDEDIIDYILKQGLHKIPDLASSIRMNGVRVPLIISYGGDLLDGNRRFLACKYLVATEKVLLNNFTTVPVKCVAPHASASLKLKIIAEMNFLDQHKEEWPRNVRAQFAVQEFEKARRRLADDDKAYTFINYFLQVGRADLKRFQAVLAMIKEYVESVGQTGQKARQEAERFGRSKFQLFEEFYNKALAGAGAIKEPNVAAESKALLYRYIVNQQLLSITNVREFAKVVRYEAARNQLKKPSGSFSLAKSLYDEYSTPRKATARVTRFCEWLENLPSDERSQISSTLADRLFHAVQALMGK